MRKDYSKVFQLLLGVGLALLLASCGNLKDSTTAKMVQKRKYTKGFHVNLKIPKTHKNPNRDDCDEARIAILQEVDSANKPAEIVQEIELPPNSAGTFSASLSEMEFDIIDENASRQAHSLIPGKFEIDDAPVSSEARHSFRFYKKKQKTDNNVVRKTHGLAIASFLLGTATFFVFVLSIRVGLQSDQAIAPGIIFLTAILLGLLGLIFGIVAVSKINQSPDLYKGKGWAIAGIVLQIVWGVLLLMITIAVVS